MDSRSNMRAMLESARQSIRSRAANATGTKAIKKSKTIEAASASIRHGKAQPEPSASSAAPAEELHFQKDPPPNEEGTDAANAPNATDNRMQFVKHYYRLLLAFIEDKSKYELEVPNLSSLDRVVVHALAEKCNLSHESAGSRNDRVMHLKKDILFFQHPEAAQQVNLNDVIEKVSWKESKYQIRYVRSANPAQVAVGEIGSYADEEALGKIERFRRATDEYRHATNMGYTQQDLLLAEAAARSETGNDEKEHSLALPGQLEAILSRPDLSSTASIPVSSGSSATAQPSSPPSSVSTIAAAMSRSKAVQMRAAKTTPASPMTTAYSEVCRTCGTRVRLDGPPQGWKCSHFCAHCTRQTIWSLEELKNTPEPAPLRSQHKRARDNSYGDGTAQQRRTRANVEEIDREEGEPGEQTASSSQMHGSDDDAEDAEGLTVEDVVEIAATNDFTAKDTNWLRKFASRPTAHLTDQLAFCIEFGDLAEARIFRRYEDVSKSPETTCWYVVLREVRALSLTVSDLLCELLYEAFTDPSVTATSPSSSSAAETIQSESAAEHAMEHLGIAFPNLSVYGTECVAVCQLRPVVPWATVPRLTVQDSFLRQLRQRYGARHVFSSSSLAEALQHAGEQPV